MDIMAWLVGSMGVAFALIAYERVSALEKKLKDLGVLDESFDSEKEIERKP